MPTRVLIAEDNEIMRSRLVELLDGQDGWSVCGAVGNGQEAVEKATDLHPDVIVMDLAMPVMDGLSATREILRSRPTLPILIYTLHSIPAIELEAKKAGARKVILKPHSDLLIAALKEILATEPRGSEAKSAPNAALPPSAINPAATATETRVSDDARDAVATLSATPPVSEPTANSIAEASVAPGGAETISELSNGASATPPAISEPEPSA